MLTTKLFPYQIDGVRFLRDADGTALLADSVGLGKTLQALYYSWRYLPADPPGPIVVIAPAHLKTVWKRQAQQHLNLRAEVLSGERVPADKRPPVNPNQIYVLNPEILTPDLWPARTAPPAHSWIVWLANLKPRLVIADEAHLFSNSSAARTRGLRWLVRHVPRCLLLTGTPLPNKPENLWSLLNILRPKEFSSKFDFCSEFATPVSTPWGIQFKGARNLDRLHQRLGHVMLRRRKEDVLKDLPAVTYSTVPMDCDLTEYRRAQKDVVAWIGEQDAAAGARAARAAELAKLNTLTQLAAHAKLDAVVKWVKSFLEESGRKLLLGAVHYKVTGALMDAVGRKGVLVDGTMSEKKKDAAFDRFNLDNTCRVLVGNIHAAGTGWSCKSASDAAIVELPWRPADITQFAGRIHGVERGIPGTAAHVRFLAAAETIEERMCELLQAKARWASEAVDGRADAADLDLHTQIREHLRKGGN